jgi:5,10-methylenetetrahydromethanopterin reductase
VSPPRRELGLALQTDKPSGAYAALARRAEEAGFDVVTTFNDLWFQPALLEIAAATERVRVGPSCLAAFAGEAADELKVGGSANPALVPHMRACAGSDRVGIVLGAVTVVDEDGTRARAAARREVAMYVDVVGALDPTAPVEPELLRRIGALVAAGDHAAAGALIPDDMLSLFAFAGTPADVATQAEAVLDAGALRVDFGTPHGIDEEHGVELLCNEVLPRLRVS